MWYTCAVAPYSADGAVADAVCCALGCCVGTNTRVEISVGKPVDRQRHTAASYSCVNVSVITISASLSIIHRASGDDRSMTFSRCLFERESDLDRDLPVSD